MKYFVLIPDGMADYPLPSLGGKTPMEAANKPMMDRLAREAFVGLVSNVPDGMVPESDTANLAILSYDPKVYSNGRSPLEAVSMGLSLSEEDTAIRCNVVTLSEEPEAYEEKTILDHSADEISTAEAAELIRTVNAELGTDDIRFYPGISYRHCLLWRNVPDLVDFARPHDHLGERIAPFLPAGEKGKPFLELMQRSYGILNRHPVNERRRERGLKPANSIWLWSPGKKPQLPDFFEKWGVRGTVISAVDLIKGIGICAGMKTVDVEGATGNFRTNYRGKAEAAIEAFKTGSDFVYVHVEGPDECGHRAETENKITCIERIDREILTPVFEALRSFGEPFRIMVLPDHPTPISRRTHTMDPVPFLIWSSDRKREGAESFTEDGVGVSGFYLPDGSELLSYLIT